jgi:diaminopimelate decarboxylase
MEMAAHAGVEPVYVDCGGGFPVPGEGTLEGGTYIDQQLSIEALARDLSALLKAHPSVSEVWFENGRFVTARSAVLVLRVIDVKERSDCRYLICDGGRTNHALPADWEWHPIGTLPARMGPTIKTVVCGPTCTAYDRLTARPMPDDIAPGDHLVWFTAGAYHLSWETRFSHGLAKVIWCDGDRRLRIARPEETPAQWWDSWTDEDRP